MGNLCETGTYTLKLPLGDWIEENNLDQYYDFSLPEFNSGRIVLGKLDLTGTNKENVLEEMLKCTGITNIELEDE